MSEEKKLSLVAVQRIGTWILAGIFLAVGLTAAVLAVYFSATQTKEKPVLMSSSDAAQKQVISMMDALCAGQFDVASTYMTGDPSLGVDRAASDVAASMIWDSFVESTSYTLSGDCYVTDDGLAQNVTFTCLDMESVNKNLRERAQNLLKQRVEEAEDTATIYDENNEYREDVVTAVLIDAVEDALREDATMITTTVTVQLKYEDGTWWIEPDQELLDVFFGDVLFYATSSEK